MSARPALKFKLRRSNAFHTSRQVSELFKKLVPGAQFQWERISSAVQPLRSLRGSEVESTISSRYSSFRCRERSLDPGKLRRATLHSRTNGVFPIGLRRPSVFGSDWRRGKVWLVFRLHAASPVEDRPKYASLSASQWLSRPPLHVRWMQTCLRIIGLRFPQSNLERDRWNASRRALGRAEKVQPIGKESRGRRTLRTPPPCPLRITSLKARFPPEHPP